MLHHCTLFFICDHEYTTQWVKYQLLGMLMRSRGPWAWLTHADKRRTFFPVTFLSITKIDITKCDRHICTYVRIYTYSENAT